MWWWPLICWWPADTNEIQVRAWGFIFWREVVVNIVLLNVTAEAFGALIYESLPPAHTQGSYLMVASYLLGGFWREIGVWGVRIGLLNMYTLDTFI